jgi:hypothetical protein
VRTAIDALAQPRAHETRHLFERQADALREMAEFALTRDDDCAFPGRDRTMKRREIHHVTPWTHGGATSTNNLIMLCTHHHQTIHNSTRRTRIVDGQPEFIPPEWAARYRMRRAGA